MTWIKRNLFFVIGLAVGLILTGFCGFLFYKDLADNTELNDEFQQSAGSYNSLLSTPPYPSDDNIKMAKDDQASAAQFLNDLGKVFAPFPPVPAEDERGFKAYLEDTIFELSAAATNAEVQLPADFAFAFTDQQKKLNYPDDAIPLWMQQLAEIKALCAVIFQSKVNALISLQRVHVSDSDTGTATDYLETRPTTNDMQVASPYMISFRGFSREIAAVLQGLARASNCFVVVSISVQPSPEGANVPAYVASPITPAPAASPIPREGPPPGVDPRAWFRQMREGGTPAPAPAPRPQFNPYSAVPVTVLSERLLQVTMLVDVVKLTGGNR